MVVEKIDMINIPSFESEIATLSIKVHFKEQPLGVHFEKLFTDIHSYDQ